MRLSIAVFAISLSLPAQVLVERSLTTGAAASASGAGKSTGKALGNIGKALGSVGGNTPAAQPATITAPSPAKPAAEPPPAKLPDIAEVTAGMEREELIKKFGEPSSKISMSEGSKFVERFRYSTKAEFVRVILENGKVTEATAGKN